MVSTTRASLIFLRRPTKKLSVNLLETIMNKFTYGSVCSGIEAASVAWHDIGEPLWLSEIDKFPSAVLAHRYPSVPNLGDMTVLPGMILNRVVPAPDVLVGGTPCQAFSVAGSRRSLDDHRGNLTLTLIHILEAIDCVRRLEWKPPCTLVWENVPGVLNTKDNAFGHFLGGLVGSDRALDPPRGRWTNSGMVRGQREVVWRVLDAQYFGVAQRRRRVFLVAGAPGQRIREVLIERKRSHWDPSPGRVEEHHPTGYVESSFAQYRQSSVSAPLRASRGTIGGGSETLVVHGTQGPITSINTALCLGRNNGQENILLDAARRSDVRCMAIAGNTIGRQPTTGGNGVCDKTIVRKLTPVECERLQGFPDDWTKVPYRGKSADDCPDSPRYKAIGNSMAVPVMRWIGKRLRDKVT